MRMNGIMYIGAMGLVALVMNGCSSSKKMSKFDEIGTSNATIINKGGHTDSSYLILTDEQRSAIRSGNEFAINLFKTQTDMSNNVISPLSVSYLMGMLANGAEGNTQKEILKTLGVGDLSLQTLNETYRAVLNTASAHDESTTINIANCVAIDKKFKVKDSFTNIVSSMYDASIENIDFASPKAVNVINGWCDKQTKGMIPKIIDKLSSGDVAVLMNAIYFDGTWTNKFEKSQTKEENFQGYTRDIKRVKMMRQEDKFFYTSQDKFEAIELPYGNRSYSMTVLMPKAGVSISEMMESLDAKKMEHLNADMEKCIVDLKLPKFTISTSLSLNDPISKLGAPSVFSPSEANFSNMSDASVYISKMLQKAKIEVSEEGTKAAAVTMGMVALTSLHPNEPRKVKFYANRPFVYVITEQQSGAIFFIGQYLGNE